MNVTIINFFHCHRAWDVDDCPPFSPISACCQRLQRRRKSSQHSQKSSFSWSFRFGHRVDTSWSNGWKVCPADIEPVVKELVASRLIMVQSISSIAVDQASGNKKVRGLRGRSIPKNRPNFAAFNPLVLISSVLRFILRRNVRRLGPLTAAIRELVKPPPTQVAEINVTTPSRNCLHILDSNKWIKFSAFVILLLPKTVVKRKQIQYQP